MLAKLADEDLVVFVIWSDWGSGAGPDIANQASALLSDDRVTQYWDGPEQPSKVLASGFRSMGVETGDVYVGFPRGVEWTDKTPAGMAFELPGFPKKADGRTLDPGALRELVKGILL